MDHSCEQFQSRGPGVQFRRRPGNPIFQQSARSDWGDSDSTELAEVLPDIASRRFRRRGEVGRTNPPHERSERGRFGSLTHHEARPSEWPGPFKKQHAVVRSGFKATESISGLVLVVPQNVPCVPQKCSTWNRVVSWRLRWLSADNFRTSPNRINSPSSEACNPRRPREDLLAAIHPGEFRKRLDPAWREPLRV
jgi:hypothetical protein